MSVAKAVLLAIVLALVGIGGFVYSGMYDIGADSPHWPVTFDVLQTFRGRSIATHAKDIPVPDLADPKRVALGAAHYVEMCTGCHLAPGMEDTEIRQGLYPVPPKLFEPGPSDPARDFWVIKHGIKSTAMPAWGTTHDDEVIWGLVAFLQKLPKMSPQEYAQMTGADDDHAEHHHDHGDADEHQP